MNKNTITHSSAMELIRKECELGEARMVSFLNEQTEDLSLACEYHKGDVVPVIEMLRRNKTFDLPYILGSWEKQNPNPSKELKAKLNILRNWLKLWPKRNIYVRNVIFS